MHVDHSLKKTHDAELPTCAQKSRVAAELVINAKYSAGNKRVDDVFANKSTLKNYITI